MRRSWAALLALAVMAGVGIAAEEEAGFIKLFNGQDFTTWVITAGPANAKEAWSVRDGLIDCTGKNEGSWLRTEKQYKDFILRFEYKIARDMNSGLFLRSAIEGNPAFSGMEIQLHGDKPGSAPSIYENGAVYAAIPPASVPLHLDKPGVDDESEWNKMEVDLRGLHLKINLNGIQIIDVRLDDPEWTARIKQGKPFAERLPEGYIGLQNHGSPAQFRNIRIKPL